jgi:prevent-host-death family protein
VQVRISDAKAQLTHLVHLAEAGEDIQLMRHGRIVARIVPVAARNSAAVTRSILEEIISEARSNPSPGPDAARSQDFLYDDEGLPR